MFGNNMFGNNMFGNNMVGNRTVYGIGRGDSELRVLGHTPATLAGFGGGMGGFDRVPVGAWGLPSGEGAAETVDLFWEAVVLEMPDEFLYSGAAGAVVDVVEGIAFTAPGATCLVCTR